MKKLVLRIVSIAAAFLLGVLGMGYYLMAGNTDSTAHMASATLPLIYLEQGGRSFNLMHGYTKSMDASSIRDAVLPLPEDREISLRIESPDTAVQDIHYEVRSLDMDRLIEDGELEFTREGDTIRADFQLMDLLEDGGEYLLALRLSLEQGREAYYYTHIANVGGTHLMECLELVDTIHGALFDKDNTVSIAQYMETDSSADNDTLDYVSIHSRYNQMIWANMEVEPPEGEVRTYITEIENAVASIRLEYELDYTNEEEETERYEVTESFRVRYTEQRMYLLNYERRVDRIFEPDPSVFSEKSPSGVPAGGYALMLRLTDMRKMPYSATTSPGERTDLPIRSAQIEHDAVFPQSLRAMASAERMMRRPSGESSRQPMRRTHSFSVRRLPPTESATMSDISRSMPVSVPTMGPLIRDHSLRRSRSR